MAVIKVRRPISIENIYVGVTCPTCEHTVNLHMRKPVTRKNCPVCNRVTYVISVTPLRGFVEIQVTTTGSDETPREYILDPRDVEIVYEENEDGDEGPQEGL